MEGIEEDIRQGQALKGFRAIIRNLTFTQSIVYIKSWSDLAF